MTAQALFLGTGASMGIPIIGCDCSVCSSSSLYNQRMRSSLLLSIGKKRYLIDVGPDFRMQALKHGIDRLDGVLLTHGHYDHVSGLDDLRIFYLRQKTPIPCALSKETLKEIEIRYHYILAFEGKKKDAAFIPFDFHLLEKKEGEILFAGLDLKYFSYFQRETKVTGFRCKDFAYVVDISDYDESIFESLRGVRVLVIDGMSWKETRAHLGIPEVIELVKKVGCKRAYLTHVAHETDHQWTSDKLPEGMLVAYDGLKLDLW